MTGFARRVSAAAACLAGFGLLLPSGATPAGGPPGTPPMKVRVLNLPFLTFAPLFFAAEEGYFREQGLDVELVRMENTAEGIALLAHGDIDVAAGAVELGAINAVARGAHIRLVADKGHFDPGGCTAAAFLARPELIRSGRLKAAADLKGLKVQVRRANVETFLLEAVLEGSGVSLDDLDLTSLDMKARYEASLAGSLDMFFATEPWIARSAASGAAVVWVDLEERFPGFQHAGLYYGKKLLEDREAGNRFMAAYLKGVKQYSLGPTSRNLELMARLTQLDPDLISRTCLQGIRPDGEIDLGSVMDLQAWGARNGLLDAVVPPEGFWDPGFIRAAGKNLESAPP